jgi:hypothetical protein
MAVKLENKQNVIPPNATFPYGAIQDNPGNFSGTPFNTSVYGDFHQYFAKMLAESGIIANGQVENATNGFQYFDALNVTTRPFINQVPITSSTYNAATIYAATPQLAYKTLFRGIPSGGNITVNLPDTTSLLPGTPFSIVHVGSFGYTITLVPFGTDAINGGATFVLNRPGECVQLSADGNIQEWSSSSTNIEVGQFYTGESYYSTSSVLGNAEMSNLIIYTGASGFLGLPPLSDYDRYKKVKICNYGSGTLSIVTTGFLDVFNPVPAGNAISLSPGDTCELELSNTSGPVCNITSIYKQQLVQAITPVTQAVFLNGWTAVTTVKYRKNNDGLVTLQGMVTINVALGKPIFNLPSGYYPSVVRNCPATIIVNGVYDTGAVAISAAGVVQMDSQNFNLGDNVQVVLDGINFYAD